MDQFLASRRAPRVAWVVGIILVLPAFAVGFIHDDCVHRVVLEGSYPLLAKAPHQLYDFTPDPSYVERFTREGAFPWWTDPGLRLRFFRPLSSWSLYVDHLAFGRSTFWPHLHSLLWFALLSAGAIAIFRRLLAPRAASIASFLFCLAGAHAIAASWIAARHALIGAAFAVWAIELHLSWRESERPGVARGLAAPFVLLLGLASSEIAVCALIFIVLYEALGRADAPSARVRAVFPTLVLGLSYTVFYLSSGYGVAKSGLYLSPLDDPAEFAAVAVVRILDLLAELYGALPALFSQVIQETAIVFAAVGLVITLAVFGLLYRARAHFDDAEMRHLRWLGLATVACVVPVVGGSLGGRMLLVTLVGSCVILAQAFVTVRAHGGRVARGFVLGLVIAHLAIGVLARVGLAVGNAVFADAQREIATSTDFSPCGDDGQLFVLTGADPTLSMFLAPALAFHRPPAPGLPAPRILSMAAHDQVFEVVDAHTVAIAIDDDAPRYPNPFEVIYRDAPLAPGDRFEVGSLTVDVVDTEAGLWTEMQARYDRGLEHACIAHWDGEAMVVEAVPPPGTRREIPHLLGPMGM